MSSRMTRGSLIAGAAAVAAGVGVAVSRGGEHEPAVGDPLVARRVRSVPVDEPRDREWSRDGGTVLPLLAQQLAVPKLAAATVPDVDVAALHDGTTLGIRLSWVQREPSELSGVARFQDAVAIMLPAAAGAAPAITMGAKGAPVHILQWRASWQRDVELGASQGVDAQFPNVIRDLTPQDLLPPQTAVLWSPARAVGNPMAAAKRSTSVEELIAEGFGTTVALDAQRAAGAGEHHDGRWWVTIALPMARGRGLKPLKPGETWSLAVAVWSGEAENRGGRKHYADWAPMNLEA